MCQILVVSWTSFVLTLTKCIRNASLASDDDSKFRVRYIYISKYLWLQSNQVLKFCFEIIFVYKIYLLSVVLEKWFFERMWWSTRCRCWVSNEFWYINLFVFRKVTGETILVSFLRNNFKLDWQSKLKWTIEFYHFSTSERHFRSNMQRLIINSINEVTALTWNGNIFNETFHRTIKWCQRISTTMISKIILVQRIDKHWQYSLDNIDTFK